MVTPGPIKGPRGCPYLWSPPWPLLRGQVWEWEGTQVSQSAQAYLQLQAKQKCEGIFSSVLLNSVFLSIVVCVCLPFIMAWNLPAFCDCPSWQPFCDSSCQPWHPSCGGTLLKIPKMSLSFNMIRDPWAISEDQILHRDVNRVVRIGPLDPIEAHITKRFASDSTQAETSGKFRSRVERVLFFSQREAASVHGGSVSLQASYLSSCSFGCPPPLICSVDHLFVFPWMAEYSKTIWRL